MKHDKHTSQVEQKSCLKLSLDFGMIYFH